MKKITTLFLTMLIAFYGVAAYPATAFNVPVQAQVPLMLELDYWIRACPGNSTPYGQGSYDVTDLSFGRLNWDDQYKVWRADKYFTVFLVAMTSGRSYQIHETCSGFISPSTGKTLNNNLIMTPDYKEGDLWDPQDPSTAQGSLASGDRLGSKDLAVGNEKTVFDSASGLGPKIIRCYYGLATGDPSANEPAQAEVLSGQTPAGDYTGVVTFSLVLK